MMSAQLQQSEAAGNRNVSQTVAAATSSPAAAVTPAPTQAAGRGVSMRNRAGDSKSPFVRAHADTLVSWQLLDDEAVERAKRENKLIFMTIGYLASHCESRRLCVVCVDWHVCLWDTDWWASS